MITYLKRSFFAFLFTWALTIYTGNPVLGQRYNFRNYDIEDGLIQSQAQRIFQDKEHNLWITTMAGVSRFNGREFTNFDVSKGLKGVPTSLVQDGKGDIWFGGNSLIYFDGKSMRELLRPEGHDNEYFHHLVKDKEGTVWGILGFQLFKIKNNKIQPVNTPDNASADALEIDIGGNLYLALRNKGIYTNKAEKWSLVISFTKPYLELIVRRMVFDKYNKERIWLQTFTELLEVNDGKIVPYPNPRAREMKGSLYSVVQDVSGTLWVCTTYGLYNISHTTFRSFNSSNGFTDNSVNDVYSDNAGNVWIATEGSGIFRYNGDMYTRFDQTQGMPNEVVMSLAGNQQSGIWMGTFGGGLVHYKDGALKNYKIPSPIARAQSIFSLYIDTKADLWISSLRTGLWKLSKGQFTQIGGGKPMLINGIIGDMSGRMWVSSSDGCFIYEGNRLVKIESYDGHATCIEEIGKDSILVGSDEGISLIRNRRVDETFSIPLLAGKSIFSIKKYLGLVFIATSVDGLFVWDPVNGRIKNITQDDGLYSNSVYSITSDGKHIWLGTGRGINKISFDRTSMLAKIMNDHSPTRLIVEANQNSALFDGKYVWMGTAKGAFVYDPQKTVRFSRPDVKIQTVRISQPGQDTASVGKDRRLSLDTGKIHELPFKQNNLLISYAGIYLSDQEALRYQYRLVGLEDNFCVPIRATTVNYLSIPAGNYTLEVRAVLENGLSSNVKKFSFVIVPPFYQTTTFMIILFVFLVLCIVTIQYYLNSRKEQRRLLIESITKEEKRKIREQTAEDFHDDMGNKLTRISILSDMLAAKIDKEKAEERKLVDQIKESASALYKGTKDILWALDPKADNLHEILSHLHYFGSDLFSNTGIEFRFCEPVEEYKDVRLPMEYSRNITMIFKELMHNVLKHSEASQVTIDAHVEHTIVKIVLSDDGKGFNVEQRTGGKGLINIQNRSSRVKGKLTINSKKGEGTVIELLVKKTFKEYDHR